MKNDILNCVLFWPKNEWNPHSKALFFSWYGLCGDNKIFIPNNINANIGINMKKMLNLSFYVYFIYLFEVNIEVNL